MFVHVLTVSGDFAKEVARPICPTSRYSLLYCENFTAFVPRAHLTPGTRS